GFTAYDVSDGVDVPLHDVSPEPGAGGDGTLHVDPVSGCQRTEPGLGERLGHHIGGPRLVAASGHGETAAVDRDGVTQPGVREHGRAPHGQPDGVRLTFERLDRAELLDDPGEHSGPSRSGGTHRDAYVGVVTVGERLHAGDVGDRRVQRLGDRVDSQVTHRAAAGTEHHRRDVGDDLVDE